jgi:hypothetical protein
MLRTCFVSMWRKKRLHWNLWIVLVIGMCCCTTVPWYAYLHVWLSILCLFNILSAFLAWSENLHELISVVRSHDCWYMVTMLTRGSDYLPNLAVSKGMAELLMNVWS